LSLPCLYYFALLPVVVHNLVIFGQRVSWSILSYGDLGGRKRLIQIFCHLSLARLSMKIGEYVLGRIAKESRSSVLLMTTVTFQSEKVGFGAFIDLEHVCQTTVVEDWAL
jgi:hypothetical protein